MACYIISYDLRGTNRDYSGLIAAIKAYGTWAHITESTWAVVTDEAAKDIRDRLLAHITTVDRLFVVKSGVESAWRNVMCKNEWLKTHL